MRRVLGQGPWVLMTALCLLVPGNATLAAEVIVDDTSDELSDLSLEQLLDVQVTSVSRRQESMVDAAAAVFVVTSEDIRRIGASSIPEALRIVPGLDVSQIDSSRWAISARGFSNRYANKLLVLVDGRTVYTPMFSGVFWDAQNPLMDDIDRIEVIRGPGGTLWGANAVNGVINIITKSAIDTERTYVSVSTGDEATLNTGVRHGGKAGRSGYYRVYGNVRDHDGFDPSFGDEPLDSWANTQGGFRYDRDFFNGDKITVQGDVYSGDLDVVIPPLVPSVPVPTPFESEYSGSNLSATWSRRFHETSDLSMQFVADHADRDEGVLRIHRQTYELTAQHRFLPTGRMTVVAGGGYRTSRDETLGTEIVSLNPASETLDLWQMYAQSEMKLGDSWRFISGIKLEDNTLSGLEVLPSVRAAYSVSENQTFWTAASRAVGIPDRVTTAGTLNQGVMPGLPPIQVRILANPDIDSETLLAYEAGYRIAPGPNSTIDIAAYHHSYDDIRTTTPGAPFPEPPTAPLVIVQPLRFTSLGEGTTTGIEISGGVTLTPNLRLQGWYSFIDSDLQAELGSEMTLAFDTEQRGMIRSSINISENGEADVTLRHSDGSELMATDSYTDVDARFAWKIKKGIRVSVIGRSLLNDEKLEFVDTALVTLPTRIQRSGLIRLDWRF